MNTIALLLLAGMLGQDDTSTRILRMENELLRSRLAVLTEKGGDSADPTTDNNVAGETPVVAPPPPEETIPEDPPPVSLKQRIAAYRARGGQAWYVRGKSDSQHLVDDHGWTWAQINGLSAIELQYLHGMSHTNAPELTATMTQSVSHQTSACDDGGYPVTLGGDGYYHWHNPRLGERYNSSVEEGRVYGGMTYRDGKMYLNATAAPATTTRRQTYAPMIQWNYQNCPNGQCPRYSHR